MKNNTKQNSAFTLIELSIVLIIIGLIIGGILAGQELIKAAEARGVMAQLDRYTSALNAFKLRYNALPGDYASAATMIPGTPTNGDGNGLVFTGTPTSTTVVKWDAEHLLFWQHLSLIGVVEGNYTGSFTGGVVNGTQIPFLKNNRGGIIAYGSPDNNNYYHLGIGSSTTAAAAGAISTANVFLPVTAYAIDSKIDDGSPTTGSVVAATAVDTTISSYSSSVCANAATTYNIVNSPGYVCMLKYKLQ